MPVADSLPAVRKTIFLTSVSLAPLQITLYRLTHFPSTSLQPLSSPHPWVTHTLTDTSYPYPLFSLYPPFLHSLSLVWHCHWSLFRPATQRHPFNARIKYSPATMCLKAHVRLPRLPIQKNSPTSDKGFSNFKNSFHFEGCLQHLHHLHIFFACFLYFLLLLRKN